MTANGQMYPGHCSWHHGWAEDVVLVTASDCGSGPGVGSARACLPCARPLVKRSDAPAWLCDQVAAMEERAAQRHEARS